MHLVYLQLNLEYSDQPLYQPEYVNKLIFASVVMHNYLRDNCRGSHAQTYNSIMGPINLTIHVFGLCRKVCFGGVPSMSCEK